MFLHRPTLTSTLIVLLLITSLTPLTGQSPKTGSSSADTLSSPCQECFSRLQQSTRLLEKVSELLKQERSRWKTIHNNPVPDTVDVRYDTDKKIAVVTVSIDTGIQNAINRQKITRTYELRLEKPKVRVLPEPFVVCSGAMVSADAGLRPYVGIGAIDIEMLTVISRNIGDFIPFAYTNGYSVGCGIGYVFNRDYHLVVSAMSGFSFKTGYYAGGIAVGFYL